MSDIPVKRGQVWVVPKEGPLTVTFTNAHHEPGKTLMGNVWRRGFEYSEEYLREKCVVIYDPDFGPFPNVSN